MNWTNQKRGLGEENECERVEKTKGK